MQVRARAQISSITYLVQRPIQAAQILHLSTGSVIACETDHRRTDSGLTSSTDLPSTLCTRVLAVPSAEMVKRSRLHNMVAGGLDITSQLMFTGFPSHE